MMLENFYTIIFDVINDLLEPRHHKRLNIHKIDCSKENIDMSSALDMFSKYIKNNQINSVSGLFSLEDPWGNGKIIC